LLIASIVSTVSGALSSPFLTASSATKSCSASWSTRNRRDSGVSGRPEPAFCFASLSTVRWLIAVPFTVTAAGLFGPASVAGLHAPRVSNDAAPARSIPLLMEFMISILPS
jgi:hypothetical protein